MNCEIAPSTIAPPAANYAHAVLSEGPSKLLHTAGVSFAVLGDGESCTGDPARRAGNEILFQMLASVVRIAMAVAQRVRASQAAAIDQ